MADLERLVRGVVSARAGRKSAGTGCLETAAIAVFALLIGAFAASTWMRHADGDDERPRGAVPAGDSLAAPSLERARIRVEVRNGSGIPGAAARVTEHLRAVGFDVVDFGNADEFDQARTVVIDRIGAPERAREVAAALRGVPIVSRVDTTLYLDVTVLVGRDAPERVGDAQADGGGRWRGWIDRLGDLLP